MKKMLIHIGRHKTGTSSLQRLCVHNRNTLQKNNILYPWTGIKGYGHHRLASELTRKKSSHPLFSLKNIDILNQFKKEALSSTCDCILLSSEAFQNCAPRTIRQAFAEFDSHVICYIRNRADYLASAYAQKVHATNYANDIEHFYANFFKLDYIKFISEWEKYFLKRFHIHVFDRHHLQHGDVATDFSSRYLAGIPSLSVNLDDANPSLGYDLVTVKRALNDQYPDLFPNAGLYQALSQKAAEKKQQKITIPYNVFQKLSASSDAENTFLAARLHISPVFEYKYDARPNVLHELYIQEVIEELVNIDPGIDPKLIMEKTLEIHEKS